MKSPKIFYLTLILLTCLFGIAFSSPSEIQREIIVMFKPGVISLPVGRISAPLDSVIINPTTIRSVLTLFNPQLIIKGFPEHDPADTVAISETGQVIKKLDLSLVYKIRLPEGVNRDALIRILKTIPEVIYAEPNATPVLFSPVFPNDGYFGWQWCLYNTGQFGGVYRADIHAPEAWEIFKGSSTRKIGIIDSGVDGGHEDLSGKVSGDAGYDSPHGTHVAGIASAITNNSIGVAGVDWYAQIISQRVYNFGLTDIYNAVVDAVNMGADVLNNSWGLPEDKYSITVRSAFAYAYKMNRVATAAMGNDWGPAVNWPAAFGQGIMAVGATDTADVKADFSTTGNHIDVTAPGVYIYSCVPYFPYYEPWPGTSMATPFVTGLASLLKGYKTNLYNDDIEQIIRISADDVNYLTKPGWDEDLGTGRINARKALDLLRHPYYLVQSTASGAYRAGNTGLYTAYFFDTPGLAPGPYLVKRYEARKDITLPREFWGTNYVWGRGVSTNGYSAENPNFGMGYCNAVPGSITPTTATLYSYVYDVWTISGDHVGWVPCAPENVSFAYSVLGEPKLLASTLSGFRSGIGNTPYIRISWSDPNVNELGYKVERKDATNNQWSVIASLDSNHTSYDHVNFVGSETYTYRVRAYNAHQNSAYSNERVIKARPSSPSNFQASVECGSWGYPKISPASCDSETQPPTLYAIWPPPMCLKYTNLIFLSWSPPTNQKLPISYYVERIAEHGGSTTYDGPIYALADTLCLKINKTYDLHVICLDSQGDTSYLSSLQTETTGDDNACPGYAEKSAVGGNLPENSFFVQNYPNPFNLGTNISFYLPEKSHVALQIYNILGERVKTLANGTFESGTHVVTWDGTNGNGESVSTGVYFYRVKAGENVVTKKMTLVK